MKKRLFSLVLCLCLICSVLAAPAIAAHVCTDADGDYWCDTCYEVMPHYCCAYGQARCNICGTEMEHTCVYDEYSIHCLKCYQPKAHACEDGDQDYYCDLCYGIMPHSCVNKDGDVWCDLAGCMIEHTCVDKDKNYWCDLCDYWIDHVCTDANGDYFCDKCEDVIPHECYSNDGDVWCDICGWFAGAFTYPSIGGTIKSSGSDLTPVYVDIYDSYGDLYNFAILTGPSAQYVLDVYEDETYTVVITKADHATATYTVVVGADPVPLNVTLSPNTSTGLIGDVSGDGKLNMGDVAKIYAHIKGTSKLTDPDTLDRADASGDGKLNMGDVAKVYAHVKGTSLLW